MTVCFTAEIFSKTTAEQQGLYCITMSSPNSAIEGTDLISIARGNINNTCTSNVLPFGAGIPAASEGITIASDTGSSNQAESINTHVHHMLSNASCCNHQDTDTYCVRTEYMSGGYPMFQHIQDNKATQDPQDDQHHCKHEHSTPSPEEASVWVVLCVAQTEQHQRATTRHQCWHEAARIN
eukprot:6680508-Ditylum_brightwellii.AAC.1